MLHVKYRPKSLEAFVGNDKAKAIIRRHVERGTLAGAAYWITGPSGIGKTSLAEIICRLAGADDHVITELDSVNCTVSRIRELERSIQLRPLFGSATAIIVNEAHRIEARAVDAFLCMLERLPPWVVIVFTTTQESAEDLFGDFTSPFLSRCRVIQLSSYGVRDAMASRAKEIAEAEGLDGQPLEKYKRLVQDCKNNFRMVLSRIDNGDML